VGLDPSQAADEHRRLAELADDNYYAFGPTQVAVEYAARVFSRHWRGTSCLEVSSGEGLMTPILAERFADLTVVEGSRAFCERIKVRFPGANVVHALAEDFRPGRAFDTVVMNDILEHVVSPPELLAALRAWMAPGGVACVASPNAHSLHRQLGRILGMLADVHDLNEADLRNGHRRVYDARTLRAELEDAGFVVEASGGFWLKLVSDTQIQSAGWSREMLDACMSLGEAHPDIAADVYVIVRRR
jgi:2-polyprenyl-3-methyl-5-hydroxy-6-metoxy-1,4-benzoquinol methylase